MKKLIVFSGLDGAGKSTQIYLLIDAIREQGFSPYYIWSRGGYTPFFNFIKDFLRRASGGRVIPKSGFSLKRERVFSRSWIQTLWLMIAIGDLILLYGIWLRFLKLIGKVVICDRYIWDTQIDFRMNFPGTTVEKWWIWSLFDLITPVPDTAFLLLIPVPESIKRSDIKGEPFRDSAQILADRLEHYQELARLNYWMVLDGTQPVPVLANLIRNKVIA